MSDVREHVMRDVVTHLEHVDDRGCADLMGTAEATFLLDNGPDKERWLIRLAAEAIFYATSLRDEREGFLSVTLTPETYGEHVVRFDPGVRSVDGNDAPAAKTTVTSIDTQWCCRCGALNGPMAQFCYACPGLREDHQ